MCRCMSPQSFTAHGGTHLTLHTIGLPPQAERLYQASFGERGSPLQVLYGAGEAATGAKATSTSM